MFIYSLCDIYKGETYSPCYYNAKGDIVPFLGTLI